MIRDVLPLTALNDGESAIVVDICGGRRLTQHLMNLGIVRGKKITVHQNSGPVIASVGDTKMGLGKGIASSVMVRVE